MRLALLAAVAALVGCLLLVILVSSSRSSQQATAQAHPTVPGPRASRSSAQAEEFLGVVLPQESVELAAPFEGSLASVAVKVGDRVQAGTELAQLDLGQLRIQESMARATLAGAEAQEQEATLAVDAAKEKLQRYMKPLTGTFAEQEISAARYEESAATARLQAARAHTQERQAALAQIRLQLEQGTLRAPFDGLVSVRYLDPGAKVQSGTPLFRLIRAGQLRVRFAVPDTHGITFSAGTPVRILLPEQGRHLAGKVESISPEVDTASRMLFALALLDAEGDARTAVSGMVARVSLDTALSPATGSSAPPPATSTAE